MIYRLAILACKDNRRKCVIGLLLRRRQYADTSLPQYYVGASFWDGRNQRRSCEELLPRRSRVYRLITITPQTLHTLALLDSRGTARLGSPHEWCSEKDIFIMHRPPRLSYRPQVRYDVGPPRFRVPDWVDTEPARYGFIRDTEAQLPSPSSTSPLYSVIEVLSFYNQRTRERFSVQLGRCGLSLWATASISPSSASSTIQYFHVHTNSTHHNPLDLTHHQGSVIDSERTSAPRGLRNLHARVALGEDLPGRSDPTSSTVLSQAAEGLAKVPSATCEKYHVESWSRGSMSFGDQDRTVQLTFCRWPSADEHCLEIRLRGRVYDVMRSAKVA